MSEQMNSYRVLLVRPPYSRLRGFGQAPYFPLGIGYLTSILNQEPDIDARLYYSENPEAGEALIVIDKQGVFETRSSSQAKYFKALDNKDHPVWAEVKSVIREYKPHVLGLSVLTPEVGSALVVARIAREINPEIRIVWGGVHPSFLPEETIKYNEANYVVVGEGENSFLQLVKALKNNESTINIPGVYSEEGKPSFCSNSLIEKLDTIPAPDRKSVIFPERFSPVALGSLMHSRGCPWKCGFCSSRRFWQEKVRFRTAGEVVDEIESVIRDYGIRIFTFWDDAFTIDRAITEELCEEIIRRTPKIAWRTATRMDLLDDSMLRLLKRAGCVQLELGIESGSKRISKLIQKDIDLDAAPEIIERANRHGIACGVFLMAGFPDETRQDLLDTLNFMKKIKPAEIVLNIFDPMPGSEQFDRVIELGLLEEPIDFARFPLWPDAHFVHALKPAEFNDLAEQISNFAFNYNTSKTALYRRAKPEILQLMRTDRRVLLQKGVRFIKNRISRKFH